MNNPGYGYHPTHTSFESTKVRDSYFKIQPTNQPPPSLVVHAARAQKKKLQFHNSCEEKNVSYFK